MDLNKGVPTLFAYCEKLIWKMFFKFKQGTCPWMAFAWNFFGIFLIFFRGVCGANYLSLFLSLSLLLYLCSPSPNNATAFCKAANIAYGACFFLSVCSSLCHCLSVCLFPSPLPSKYVSSETANFHQGIFFFNLFQNESFNSANSRCLVT